MASSSAGYSEPSLSCVPASILAPASTNRRVRRGNVWRYSSPASSVMTTVSDFSVSSTPTFPPTSAILASPLGLRASNSSTTRGRPCVMSAPATPPVWNVRMVSCVPGSPIDWAAMMPTASPIWASLPEASERP